MRIGKFIKTIIFAPRIIPFTIPKRTTKPEEQPIPVQIPKREPVLVPSQPDHK
jgi:hypothetical protein